MRGPRNITEVRAYYRNPDMLRRHLARWEELSDALRSRLRIILVDDGSPQDRAEDVLRKWGTLPLPISLFELEVDVRWNWLAARNIGASRAPAGWLFITDMDHVAPDVTYERLINGKLDESRIYRFSREEHTGVSIHPHPNSWAMTRDMYWAVGGHDEALSGYYGTDGDYRRRCAATAIVTFLLEPLIRYERVGDSSTTRYLRKQPEDAEAKRIMRTRPRVGWRPKVLSFPYHEVRL